MAMNVDLKILQELIDGNYLYRREHPDGGLFLYNYTPKVQYEPHWTPETLMCRGLITDADGKIVARPFDKFFNWLEGERRSDAPIKHVTEKMDGSLGILYRHKGKWQIATRGSFDSEQALWATNQLKKHPPIDVPENVTLLFEIIYPENRIVVDYGTRAELVLLDGRYTDTGKYLAYPELEILADNHYFPLVKAYRFGDIAQLLETMDTLTANEEGYVVTFEDGQRFKFKGEAYLTIHRLVTRLSFKRVLEAIVNGNFQEILDQLPDEFLEQVRQWQVEIMTTTLRILDDVDKAFEAAPKETQKDFALWVQANHSRQMQGYLFAKKSGKNIMPIIYKTAFEGRKALDKPLVEVEL